MYRYQCFGQGVGELIMIIGCVSTATGRLESIHRPLRSPNETKRGDYLTRGHHERGADRGDQQRKDK